MLPEVEEMVESLPKLLRLDDAQLAELSRLSEDLAGTSSWWGESADGIEASKPKVILIEPRRDAFYNVTIRNAIGAVGLPGLELIVRPKIPFAHFAYLSSYAMRQTDRLADSATWLGADASFQDLVAAWFTQALETLMVTGLARDYHPDRQWMGVVRGQVRLTSTVMGWLSGRAGADCEFDEFDTNTPLNRILRRACSAVAASSTISERIRARATRLLRNFEGVGPMLLTDLRHPLDRANLHYTDALKLAREIIASQGRSLSVGALPGKTFLYSTPDLIEEGIRAVLQQGLAPMKVRKRGRLLLPSRLSVNPDLEFARPPFTGDVKYKVAGRDWVRPDLAQAVFFAAAYRSPLAIIFAFGNEGSRAQLPLLVGDINVHSILWEVGEGTTPALSAEQVVEASRELVHSRLPERHVA